MKLSGTLIFFAFVALVVTPPSAFGSDELEDLTSDMYERYGSDPAALSREAVESYREGDYSAAAVFYMKALLSDLDDNPLALYNLACCFGLMGEEELACDVLLEAAREGFDMMEIVAGDTDFSLISDGERFAGCLVEMEEIIDNRKMLESEEIVGDRVYLEFPSMQTSRVHVPDDFDPDGSYDLVIALHGYGGDVSEFSTRWDAFERRDFIFASLQAPYAFDGQGRTVYSWTVHGSSQWDGGDMPPEQMEEMYGHSLDLSSDMVVAYLDALKQRYMIDDVFLLGFSQGGIVTYRTALRNPELFKGIATFSGILGEDIATDQMLESASFLPVFIGRGTQEDERALLAMDRFVENGYQVTLHEYEGGHYFPDESLRAFESWFHDIQ